MNDLLNEDEFLPKEYNPNRWFIAFYILGSLLSMLTFSMVRFYRELFNNITATITIVFTFLLPLILSLIMVFAKKQNILLLLPIKAAYKIFLLSFFCGISILTIGIIVSYKNSSPNLNIFTNMLYIVLSVGGVYLIVYTLTIAIILSILKRVQKVNKNLPQ